MRWTLGSATCAVAMVVVAAAPAGGSPATSRDWVQDHRRITVVDIGSDNSGLGVVDLSERGHVVFRQSDVDASGQLRAFRWYRGQTMELTPDLPNGVASYPTAVNDRGQVVGYTVDETGGSGLRGFAWDRGSLTMLPDALSGPGQSSANDIDRYGRVLVNRPEGTTYRAGVWDGRHEITSPDVLDDLPMSGIDMNDRAQVVGNAFPSTAAGTTSQAFRWRSGRAPVALGSLGGPSGSEAVEINEAGSVLGYSTTPQNDQRMFLWRHGRMIDLGTLGGAQTRLGFAVVGRSDRLNDFGQVAGTSETVSGDLHAFRWSNGRMRDLGTLGGATSYAFGINNRGEVVGMSQRRTGEFSAFLWRHGTMTDLGALTDSTDSLASAINDRGQILGYRFNNSEFRAVLWEER